MRHSQLMKSHNQMIEAPNKIPLLIIGNSHSLAIQTSYFSGSVVTASYAEEIHNTYFKLNYLIRILGKRPDTVFMSYDLGLLRYKNFDRQHHQFYWNKFEDPFELSAFSDDGIVFWMTRIFAWAFPYHDGEIEVFDYLFAKKSSLGEEMRGEQKVIGLPDDALREIDEECLNEQISEYGQFYLEQILKLLNDVGSELVLIRFPVSENFYYTHSKCFDPERYYEKVFSESLSQYNHVKVLDFHDLCPDSDFRDSHHLKSGQPRILLTERIVKALKP